MKQRRSVQPGCPHLRSSAVQLVVDDAVGTIRVRFGISQLYSQEIEHTVAERAARARELGCATTVVRVSAPP